MKKFCLLLLALLFMQPVFSFAQDCKEKRVGHEFNFMALAANKPECKGSLAVNYTFSYKVVKDFGIGAGAGYEWMSQDAWIGAVGSNTTRYAGVPVFADFRYDIPFNNGKLFLTGVVDTGVEFGAGEWKRFDSSWIISPQLGFKIKLYSSLSLNVRFAYRYIHAIHANSVGANVGISF